MNSTNTPDTTQDTTPDTGGTSVPTHMRAIVQDRYGSPDVLHLRRVAVPTPATGQVLVEVKAASLNMYDWHMTSGTPRMARVIAGVRRPKNPTPGADVSGVVVAVGSDVTRFRVGDAVMGAIGWGAFAEFAVAAQRQLAHTPPGVSFEQAAAVPLAGLTALQGLRDHGGVTTGQRVVVNGASGGVGTMAVMIAKALGAEVTAVCSTTKVDMVRTLGADHVIDYTVDDYTESVRSQHVLFDNVGTRGWKQTSRVLAPGGVTVMITGPKHGWFGPMREAIGRRLAASRSNERFVNFTASVKTDDLVTLSEMLGAGAIVPVIERTYPLAETAAALRHLGEGHARGKLVLVP
jgi:NADPH:quinone reductase-like Zn-dependent oxidoreductase